LGEGIHDKGLQGSVRGVGVAVALSDRLRKILLIGVNFRGCATSRFSRRKSMTFVIAIW
jgi:hypothetical protein